MISEERGRIYEWWLNGTLHCTCHGTSILKYHDNNHTSDLQSQCFLIENGDFIFCPRSDIDQKIIINGLIMKFNFFF